MKIAFTKSMDKFRKIFLFSIVISLLFINNFNPDEDSNTNNKLAIAGGFYSNNSNFQNEPKRSSSGFELGSWKGFYSWDEILAELDSMRLQYPNLITARDSIGHTIEGRALWAVKISDNPDVDENEPEIFYNSLIHGSEPMSMMVLMYYMHYLLDNYENEPEIKYLVDNRELYFLPVVNPDGYVYERPNSYGYRKNRKDNGDGTIGIDLNRNFGYMWGIDDKGSNPDPGSIMYRGTEAFSEPETQAIRDFSIARNFIISNALHYYGYWVYRPWLYSDSPCPDSIKFDILGNIATSRNDYIYGNAGKVINGVEVDWQYGEQILKNKTYAFTTETGGRNIDNLSNPTANDIYRAANENVYLNKCLAWGPSIIDSIPYLNNPKISSTTIDEAADSIIISVDEINPWEIETNVNAIIADLITGLNDTLKLNKYTDSSSSFFNGKFSTDEESFYEMIVQHNGVDIPFEFTLKEKYHFTSAGPVNVELKEGEQDFGRIYSFYFNLINRGDLIGISSVYLSVTSPDTNIENITPSVVSCGNLYPGTPKASPKVSVTVGENFDGDFNFNFAVISQNEFIWKDSLRNITVGIEDDNIVKDFEVSQNYPNPFNSQTVINFSIPKTTNVKCEIYDALGRLVKILFDETKPAGDHKVNFNAEGLTSGIYFYRIETPANTLTNKMLYLK